MLPSPHQVRDALLHPETLERLQAVRRWVESPNGTFPPRPSLPELPLPPVYGWRKPELEWWKQRKFSRVTWRALEMLYTPRQMELYGEDSDVPRWVCGEDSDVPRWVYGGRPVCGGVWGVWGGMCTCVWGGLPFWRTPCTPTPPNWLPTPLTGSLPP